MPQKDKKVKRLKPLGLTITMRSEEGKLLLTEIAMKFDSVLYSRIRNVYKHTRHTHTHIYTHTYMKTLPLKKKKSK